jgi:transposase
LVSSAKLLEDVYRTEQNGDVRERLLPVRRVLLDNEQTARVAENEFRSRVADVIRVEYLPKGSSDYNAVEECWRRGKDDLLVSKYYPKFFNLKSAIANYYRTRRFKLAN